MNNLLSVLVSFRGCFEYKGSIKQIDKPKWIGCYKRNASFVELAVLLSSQCLYKTRLEVVRNEI